MGRNSCEECGGKVVRRRVEFTLYGEHLGKFPAEVCTKCGEEVFDEDVSQQIDAAAKKKGLWGLSARTKVGKVGSSMAVTINKKIAEFMHLEKGEDVRIHPENKKRLIVEVL